MEKFKTRNYQLSFKKIILIIIFFLLFILLSFIKIGKVNSNIFDLLLSNFNKDKTLSTNIFTSNLDYLINNYTFNKKINYQSIKNIFITNNSNLKMANLLKDKLIKLGLSISDNDNSHLNIQINENNYQKIVTINNKEYIKIKLLLYKDDINYLNNKEIANKINNYLNNNYPNISLGIDTIDGNKSVLIFELNGNNDEEIDNSTEIIALAIYHVIDEI